MFMLIASAITQPTAIGNDLETSTRSNDSNVLFYFFYFFKLILVLI